MFDCHPGVDKRLVANATSKNMLNSSYYYTLYKRNPMQKMGFSHLKHEGLACQCTSTVSPSLSEGAKVGDTMSLDIASDNRFSSGDMYSPQASQTCNTNDQLPYFLKIIMTRFRNFLTRKKLKNIISAKRKIFQFSSTKDHPGPFPCGFPNIGISQKRDFEHF